MVIKRFIEKEAEDLSPKSFAIYIEMAPNNPSKKFDAWLRTLSNFANLSLGSRHESIEESCQLVAWLESIEEPCCLAPDFVKFHRRNYFVEDIAEESKDFADLSLVEIIEESEDFGQICRLAPDLSNPSKNLVAWLQRLSKSSSRNPKICRQLQTLEIAVCRHGFSNLIRIFC